MVHYWHESRNDEKLGVLPRGRTFQERRLFKGDTMTATTTEPMVGEDVPNVSDVNEESEKTEKKRGRKSAENDLRKPFSFPNDMLSKDGKSIERWPKDCSYKFGSTEDCHLPIKREFFKTDEIYLEYRVAGKRSKIVVIEQEIVSMTTQHNKTAGIEDATSRDKARKVLKQYDSMKKQMAELLEAGVDIDALIAGTA